MKKIRKIGLSAVLAALMFICTACTDSAGDPKEAIQTEDPAGQGADEEDALFVHYIDVGQGDATLITCGEEAMLIDAGDNDKGTAIQMYLESQNIDSLKYVIGTHPDSDHIGGMDVILTKFDCETVFLTEEEKDTATYRDVVDAIRYKGCKRTAPQVNDQYTLGSASFTILGPAELCEDSNDNSIAVLLEHGENRFYFEGDASEKEEASILETGIDIQADVYKTGHHGSKTSTSDELLAKVNPTYAVISAGVGNSYGHPSAEVLNKLRAGHIQVFRTDEQGTIVAESDAKTIMWNCSPSESWQAGEPGAAVPEETVAADNKKEQAQADAAEKIVQDEDTMEPQAKEETAQPQNSDGQEEEIVHITESGKKYHRAGCSYLKDSDIDIDRNKAEELGYEPCKKCYGR